MIIDTNMFMNLINSELENREGGTGKELRIKNTV
jgi:hypothetical protein